MDAYAAAVGLDVAAFVNAVSVSIVENVAKRTPVDTGAARSNWRTTNAHPTVLKYKPYRPYPSRWLGYGPGGSFGEKANWQGAVAQARAALRRRIEDTPVYITNNLPYINALDRGHSPQSRNFVYGGIVAGALVATRNFDFVNIDRVSR
jgi:hypothetical protein